MKIFRRMVIGALLMLALTAHATLSDFILGRQDLEVITVTDMTAEGRLHRPATPAEPVYYVAVNLGQQTLGRSRAFEKMPPKEDAIRAISKALAAQGYLPATDTTPPPTLALVFAWGTLNAEYSAGETEDTATPTNLAQIIEFLGGRQVGFTERDFDPAHSRIRLLSGLDATEGKSREALDLLERAADNFFIAFITAYDLESMKEKQRKKLWITRISCPSLGFYFSDILPSMLSLAGPHIGRETTQPVWVNASHKYKPEVTIHDAQLLEYLNTGPLPVVEAKPKPPAAPPATEK